MPIIPKFAAIRDEKNAAFRQRSVEIEIALVGLATKLHSIWIGAPGDGKTMLAESIGRSVSDGQHFSVGISKSSTDADIFGGPDVPYMVSTGLYRRNTSGKAAKSTTLLMDESFKGEGALLQACLRFFSENEFEGEPTPLLWACIASNELPPELRGATNGIPIDLGPLEESLLAFMDRFFYKVEVSSLEPGSVDWEDVVFKSVASNSGTTTLTREEILDVQSAVDQVTIPDNVLSALRELATNLPSGLNGVADSRVRVSTRTWVKALRALRGHALIDGRDAVSLKDLKWLAHAFWTTPDQRSVIAEQIAKVLSARMSEADSSFRKVEEFVAAHKEGRLIRDEQATHGLKVESGRIADKNDPRVATVGTHLLAFCQSEIDALKDSLENAEDADDIEAVKAAIKGINTKMLIVKTGLAFALKSSRK
jgi:MoxR-like ATPase